MSITMSVGRRGEDLALEYLENMGYQLEKRNFRQGSGEIDLIVSKQHLLVFVEVKTRSGCRYGLPEQMLSSRQEQKILETAEHYMINHCWGKDIRFDLISILLDKIGYSVRDLTHFQDAY